MTNTILYIATSLDGYIADRDGGIDWLSTIDESDDDYGYPDFFDSIDALIMGSHTYEQILGFGDWPYAGKQSYVFSQRPLKTPHENIAILSSSPNDALQHIHKQGYNKIWLVGGGLLTSSLLQDKLVDEFIISMIPILLGEGIPLFSASRPEEKLTLVNSKQYPSGLLQVHYRRQ